MHAVTPTQQRAAARARREKMRIGIAGPGAWTVTTYKDPLNPHAYTVRFEVAAPGGFVCNCQARVSCKHISKLQQYLAAVYTARRVPYLNRMEAANG